MAKSGCVVTRRSRPVLKPRGSARSNRAAKTFDALPKSQKHVQGIIHNEKDRGHTAVFDTGSQKSMIGRYGWERINRHDTWIYLQGVDLGGAQKAGLRLQLVDARGVVKNRLDGESYLVIVRQDLFSPNLDENLLAEDQIKCHGVKVFLLPRVFGGKKLVEARD